MSTSPFSEAFKLVHPICVQFWALYELEKWPKAMTKAQRADFETVAEQATSDGACLMEMLTEAMVNRLGKQEASVRRSPGNAARFKEWWGQFTVAAGRNKSLWIGPAMTTRHRVCAFVWANTSKSRTALRQHWAGRGLRFLRAEQLKEEKLGHESLWFDLGRISDLSSADPYIHRVKEFADNALADGEWKTFVR